jgi:hypothetical protein
MVAQRPPSVVDYIEETVASSSKSTSEPHSVASSNKSTSEPHSVRRRAIVTHKSMENALVGGVAELDIAWRTI